MNTLPHVWSDPFTTEPMDELRLEAARRFRIFSLPETLDGWKKIRPTIRRKFLAAMKVEVDHDLPLEMEETGRIERDTYDIRKIAFQTRPGVFATAALYVPHGEGPFPAIVALHGHWAQGHLAAAIQKIGHIFAQCGYVTLSIDAFGAGERDRSGKPGGEYHGHLLGGTLFSVDETLAGFQLIDNMRAVDLLQSLPFVDGENIGCTGGSGGGNQTMYLAAFDERIKAAVPVVSVGSYQSYIGGSNCTCETIPDGFGIAEESAVLALVAPRALKVCNALHDCNPTFYVAEAARSITEARKVFEAYGAGSKLTALAFNAPHSYPNEVFSNAIGFFDYYLKGAGACVPQPVPEVVPVPEAEIRTYPEGAKRPKKVMPIDRFVQEKAKRLRATVPPGDAAALASVLRIRVPRLVRDLAPGTAGKWEKHTVVDDRGRVLPFLLLRQNPKRCRVIADPRGKEEIDEAFLAEAAASGDSLLVFDQWATGECGTPFGDEVARWRQYRLARALLWLGRTLIGEWTADFVLAFQLAAKLLPGAAVSCDAFRDSAVAALFAAVLAKGSKVDLRLRQAPKSLVPSSQSPDINAFFSLALAVPGIVAWGDLDQAVKLSPGKVAFIEPHAL